MRPKPMVEIGGKPILWHIMKIYSAHGVDDFVICLGYKGYVIKEFFANYHLHTCEVSPSTWARRDRGPPLQHRAVGVTLVDTGEETMTGGRLKRALAYVDDEDFCFTYGDGLADVDITALIAYHREQGALATITAVQPPGRFGARRDRTAARAQLRGEAARRRGLVNGGFFVLSPEVGRYIAGDATVWEQEPLRELARAGQLASYRHAGFWQAMDTLRDRHQLEALWESGEAPWRVWS